MPDAARVVRSSPLAGILGGTQRRVLQVDGLECSLSEAPLLELFNLRGNPGDARFGAAVLQATGLHLPLRGNTASLDPQRQLLWLGPDEWLFKTRDGQGAAIAAALRQSLQGRHSAVVDVGDGFTTLLVQGPGAAGLLARGCPLDLHPRVFADGALAQSHIAKANVTLLCLHAGTDYEVTVRRSFAAYLVEWLSAAGA